MATASEGTKTVSCELLEWDSEHFGFPIARVTGDTLTAQSAEAIDDWCSDHGIRCLYFLAAFDDPETARVAARHGYRVVDILLTARRSLGGVDQMPLGGPEKMIVREATEGDLDYLRWLAARSHHSSRFYFDGGFPRERCDALYEEWIERGFRDPERAIRVPILGNDPVGYHVLAPLGPDREGHGELVAIDERFRRRGISHAMHVSTHRFMAARGALTQRSTMSARSIGNIRLHDRLGFLTEKVEVWHHKWFAGDGHR